MILLVRSVQLLLLQGEITTDHYRATASQVSVIKNVTKRSVSHLSMLRKFFFFFLLSNESNLSGFGNKILDTYFKNWGRRMCHDVWSCLSVRYSSKVDTVLGSHCTLESLRHMLSVSKLMKSVQPLKQKKNYPINECQFFWKLFFGFLKKVENLAKIYDVLEVLNVHINEIYKKLNKLKF